MATEIGPAYDLIHDSKTLTPTGRQKIRSGLLLPMLQNIDKNRTGKNNWQTWHNAAMIWGGARSKIRPGFNGQSPTRRTDIQYQMGISVSKEGMWYENSWGYHFYTLHALINTAETARRLGIDLWSDGRLQNMFTLPIYYTMADGMLPRFGDDTGSSVRGAWPLVRAGLSRLQGPADTLAAVDEAHLRERPSGTADRCHGGPPALKSRVFEDAGHAILHARWQAGMTAAMTFGPYGGFHGHYDKLSFVLFGFEKELGVDPGRARSPPRH